MLPTAGSLFDLSGGEGRGGGESRGRTAPSPSRKIVGTPLDPTFLPSRIVAAMRLYFRYDTRPYVLLRARARFLARSLHRLYEST